MRKVVGLAVVLFLLLSGWALAGCGGGSDKEQDPTGVTDNKGAENAGSKESSLKDIFSRSSKIESMTFEWEMTGFDIASTGTQYMQGSNIRMDMEVAGSGSATMLYLGDKNEAWMIYHDTNTAMKLGDYDADAEAVNPLEVLEEYEQNDEYIEENINIVGHETIDGKKCVVIETEDEGSYTKMWVWEEYGFPLKMEITSEGHQINYQYKKVSFDRIPDSMFEIPAGVQIIDMQMPDLESLQNMGQ
jgi:outer membrane lipoprotein-sorting protein